LPEAWQQAKQLPVTEKIALLSEQGIRFDIKRLAPPDMTLSEGMTKMDWLLSMLQQPRLFIRVRNKDLVPDMLREHHVPFEWVNEQCMSIANGSPVDKILVEDSYAVQDASSQQTGTFFEPKKGEHWWDCCAGAGGKSLLLKDKNADIYLTVSDKRESIISNLLERFRQYHHDQPRSFVLDLTDERAITQAIGTDKFDNIICDAPCTGSGTWARTPEQLYFFKHGATPEIAQLQTTIALNVSQCLKPGGRLYYITCSVFKQENEEVVENIKKGTELVLEKTQLINGIPQKADSMFIAVFRKA
jgi:16S rRNA (cytosine967-C5)-methyltransferase